MWVILSKAYISLEMLFRKHLLTNKKVLETYPLYQIIVPKKSIIDFVNHIFSHMMTDEAKHDIVYQNNHEMVSKSHPTHDLEGVYLMHLNKDESDKKHNAYEAFAVAEKDIRTS